MFNLALDETKMQDARETNEATVKPPIPKFSTSYMDHTVNPREDFYGYSAGVWVKTNQVPPDKTLWSAFDELREWNIYQLWRILEDSAADASSKPGSPKRLVGDFFKSAMNLERIEELGFKPIMHLLRRVENTYSGENLALCMAELNASGTHTFFTFYSMADKKNSSIYAFYLDQGGLSLPDREYYLADSFKEICDSYRGHVARMFELAGGESEECRKISELVLGLETNLASASRTRADLRIEEKNYNRFLTSDLSSKFPSLHLDAFLESLGVPKTEHVIIGQPEFFSSLDVLVSKTPIEHLRAYLRWQVLHANAPQLHSSVEAEDFDFFHRELLGQEKKEIRWKIATRVIDALLGEALGEIYVERHFPAEARRRVALMIDDIREVFRERLKHIPWMTDRTRAGAIVKFDKFGVKIGHPEHFRDYSSVVIDPLDYVENVHRSVAFELRRQATRVGGPVDRNEWLMTPPTVNAYFSPTENEIVFPAGILQPPFFDVTLDDAVNYASIGAVIGHEITHGYDDQGRKFDGEGNLRDWWTPDDEKEFRAKAREVALLYGSQEPLPGMHVNGELTLGENIADFGGVSIAYEALERRFSKEPERRETIDGLTPEQRFFVAWAQIWRENVREEELRRLLTTDPHSPGKYRASLPAMNHPVFDDAFPPAARVATKSLIAFW